MKTSPGPWKFGYTDNLEHPIIVDADGEIVCVMREGVSTEDGKLLAKAPELLEALKEANYLDEINIKMFRIEQRRKKGSTGIAVDDDDDALAWRKLTNTAAQLIARRNKAITHAEAARIAYASEFEPDADGDPDVGNIHANIRAMKAKLAATSAAVPEAIEQLAADRYKVVPSHESMFHRWAVAADNGAQQLYIGREGECQNMARKLMGAFLDGAFVAMQNAAALQIDWESAADNARILGASAEKELALRGRIAEMEEQMAAIGAGGVEPLPVLPAPLTPDDVAVDALAVAMKAKLAKQRSKGYGGWDTVCTQQYLSDLLRSHVDKGDPVDVANFCAFLSARGEGISTAHQTATSAPVVSDEQIKAVFLANGFTIKPGCDDLKPYVYQAARALLDAKPNFIPQADVEDQDVLTMANALIAQRTTDTLDAARYRFLRDTCWSSDKEPATVISLQMNKVWDEKIDEAMARNKKE